ncbi:GNAT family N-acetyltransferase [Virgisporangium ochraceum]|uniref:GCN5-related N-acetyltransferase n=1 Tax=Virgisporangium ochraceum TaxID=65505 RepID=A0A8J4ED89_9ACTN|nr:GNAT family N-acetyltransferase [Virgisporangium ochraceum]GIJ70466.1 hypothetical protein Voc01_053830 [Virgisporangium ochraceum]
MTGRLEKTVLDCPDPRALAAFYAAVLGMRVNEDHDDWVVIGSRPGARQLAFQRVANWTAPGEPRLHLDIRVDDVEVAERQVLALGATRLPGELAGRYRVFADPAGHPFCLVFGRHAGGWEVRPAGVDDFAACRDIAAGLPEFFTPDTVDTIAGDVTTHDSWVVTDGAAVVGFAVVKRRDPAAAEILWAAVAPERRDRGIGTALVTRVLNELRAGGTMVVEVKTLDPAAEYPPYTATYRFWTARGFIHVDTIDPLPGWEQGNPCAILVAPLAVGR